MHQGEYFNEPVTLADWSQDLCTHFWSAIRLCRNFVWNVWSVTDFTYTSSMCLSSKRLLSSILLPPARADGVRQKWELLLTVLVLHGNVSNVFPTNFHRQENFVNLLIEQPLRSWICRPHVQIDWLGELSAYVYLMIQNYVSAVESPNISATPD